MESDPSGRYLGGAGLSLWERIQRDPDFEEEKRQIQARYELPLPYDIRLNEKNWRKWLGADAALKSRNAKRGQAFLKEVAALFKRFEVPDAWQSDFIAEIAGTSLEEWRRPKFNLYQDKDGDWRWECIITPETDLTDPQILELIQREQKRYAGDPPAPVKAQNHPRKLDWRPVYDWHKRHPLFTVEEIAKKLNRPPQSVRQRFVELKKESQT